ncbi:MAG: SAM-dependent methyltransferase [Chlamydiales bacterium]|nr:SAM-dependent methyltransferase [Chlamydiales bacterium]
MKIPLLYLFPNLLWEEGDPSEVFPSNLAKAVSQIDGLIAESEKGARRFLRHFSFTHFPTFREVPLRLLNEHTPESAIDELIYPLLKGGCWGLISDCGMPCLADPGSRLVLKAHENKIPVQTFSGPSSILQALVLSGLGGQRFTFHGYLPKEHALQVKAIQEMQKSSLREESTHLFIEAPYRNEKLFKQLIEVLDPKTRLCIALDLTLPTQEVLTKRVGEWKKGGGLPQIDKRPAVFLISLQSTT